MTRRYLKTCAALMMCLPLSVFAGSWDTYHPDQYYRKKGADDYDAGRYKESFTAFKRAARYGDKPAQLGVALMLWNGEGVAGDRLQAYAWADLATERGYPAFVQVREQLWAQLSETEREQALAFGKSLYAEYGDAVAKPRLESLLHRGFVQKTGSHSGASASGLGVATLDPSARAAMTAAIFSSGAGNMPTYGEGGDAISARAARLLVVATQSVAAYSRADYYSDTNWKPKYYWRYQDNLWKDAPVGEVSVGPLRSASAKPEPAAKP